MDSREPRPLTLPKHVTCVIQPETSADEFLKIVQNSFDKGQLTSCEMFDGQHELQNRKQRSRSNKLHVANSTESNKNVCDTDTNVTEDLKSNQTENLTHCQKIGNINYEMFDSSLTQCSSAEGEKSKSHKFIMTGLHACGDLTATMIRVFTGCPDIVGLASVACCYMKLTCERGYVTVFLHS